MEKKSCPCLDDLPEEGLPTAGDELQETPSWKPS